MKCEITTNDKEILINTLCWIVAFPGIKEGEGGIRTTNGTGKKGTGLRAPTAPLYNMNKNVRNKYIKLLLEYGTIEEREGKFYPTDKGMERATKENKLLVRSKGLYDKMTYRELITYNQYIENKSTHEMLKKQMFILHDFAGKYAEQWKRDKEYLDSLKRVR